MLFGVNEMNHKRLCLYCNKELTEKRKKYCSNECAMSYLNKNRYKEDKKYRSKNIMRNLRTQKILKINTQIRNVEYKIEKLKKDTNIFMKQLKSFESLKNKVKKMQEVKMSYVQIDDLDCDGCGVGMGELNIKRMEYTCLRCGKIVR